MQKASSRRAIATDGNLRFGNSEATFITTKPLITNAILPQFARSGDRILAGLSVTNNTGNTGTLTIHGEVGGTVKFAENNPTTANLQTQAETATRAYRFGMVAGSVGEGKVRFTTQLNRTAADAFEVPLEIKPLEITEQVIETGVIPPQSPLNKGGRGDQAKIPLNVDKNTFPDAGGLDIQLASTLIPEIKAPAQQVWEDDDLPFAEPATSQLIIAANLQTLSQKYSQTFAEFNPSKRAFGLEIIADHPVNHVVMSDPLPAGFEAVDASFQTTTPTLQAKADSWQLGFRTIYRDRIIAYADHLEPGVYSLHYLVRSVTPGTFLYPGAEVHLQYAPEEFGRTADSTVVLQERG